MKVLTLEEVFMVAGGLPDAAALDELSYGAAQPPGPDAGHAVSPGSPNPADSPRDNFKEVA